MEKLDLKALAEVKRAFVAMPAGADPSMGAGPVAGGGMMTQAQASPMGGTPQMDPAAAGGDPAAGGMPMDPAAMGGAPGGAPPMDPAAMGGMPPPDAGGAPAPAPEEAPPEDAGAVPPPTGQMVLSPAEFIAILQACQGGAAGKMGKSGGKAGTEAKLDHIIGKLGGQPPAPAEQPAQ